MVNLNLKIPLFPFPGSEKCVFIWKIRLSFKLPLKCRSMSRCRSSVSWPFGPLQIASETFFDTLKSNCQDKWLTRYSALDKGGVSKWILRTHMTLIFKIMWSSIHLTMDLNTNFGIMYLWKLRWKWKKIFNHKTVFPIQFPIRKLRFSIGSVQPWPLDIRTKT